MSKLCQNKFNYGIELLRIVSMMMVVTLHVLGAGGILYSCIEGSVQWHVAWILEIICYCAVNSYALISGYVMYDSEFRYKKFIPLWLQVSFYSLGITIVFLIIAPHQVGFFAIVRGFFPVLTKQWWYFTAYAGMFFFIPFLNRMIRSLKEKEIILLGITLIMIFSILETLASLFWNNVFDTSDGYSVLWITILYILGATVKRFEAEFVNILKKYSHCKLWVLIIGCTFILITILAHNCSIYLPEGFPGKEMLQMILVNYVSPTILGFALCLLLLFSAMEIEGERFRKGTKYIAKLSFGVYLIHVHPLIWSSLMIERFRMFANMPVLKMVLCIIVTVIGIFSLCIFIEMIRYKLFEKIGVREFVFRRFKI